MAPICKLHRHRCDRDVGSGLPTQRRGPWVRSVRFRDFHATWAR